MVQFEIVVDDVSKLPEIKEGMAGSGVEYELLENEWIDRDKSRARCVIEVEDEEDAKKLRRAIGVFYAGRPGVYYAVGRTERKAKCGERIDHGTVYSKRPGPAKIRMGRPRVW